MYQVQIYQKIAKYIVCRGYKSSRRQQDIQYKKRYKSNRIQQDVEYVYGTNLLEDSKLYSKCCVSDGDITPKQNHKKYLQAEYPDNQIYIQTSEVVSISEKNENNFTPIKQKIDAYQSKDSDF